MKKIGERLSGVRYFPEHRNGMLVIFTNAPLHGNKERSGDSYYLAKCPVEDVQSINWQVSFLLNCEMDVSRLIFSLVNHFNIVANPFFSDS